MVLRKCTGSPREFDSVTRSALLITAGLCLPLLMAGCAGPQPAHRSEEMVAAALGLGEAIEFRVEGGPIDEPLGLPASGEGLTLAGAIRAAVMTDPQLQAALARVRVAMADADQARLLPNPVLSMVLRFGGDGSPGVEAGLAQDFIQVLQQRRRASAADNRLRVAASEAVTTALDVVQAVEERYAEVRALDRLAATIEERRGLLGRVLGVAQARLEAGEGTRPDVTVLEVQQAEADVELADAQVRRRAARFRLARLIGVPSDAAEWTLEDATSLPSQVAPEQAWIDAALSHRPEVQAGVWTLAALGDDAALARLFPFEGASAGIEAERDGGDWAAGPALSMPIPVFDMGQARRSRVTAEMIEARHNLTLAKRRAIEEVRVAYHELQGSAATLRRVRDELLPLQLLRREQAEVAFRAGQSDVTGVFLAERDIRAAQARAAELEQQTHSALARLNRAVGGSGVAATVQSGSASTSGQPAEPAAPNTPTPTN